MRSSVRRRSVMSSWPVRGRDHHRVAQCDIAQHERYIMLDVALERAGGLAMGDDVVKRAAGFHDVRCQSVHLDIALVADHEALFCIEHQQALRHVVDRGVEPLFFKRQPLLRLAVLLRQLAHHEKQQEDDRKHGGRGDRDQDADLLAPVGQRRRCLRGRHDHDGKLAQCT